MGKMLQPTLQLADAVLGSATQKNIFLGKRAAADRAMRGNRDGAGSGWPLFQVYGKNGWNYFPRFFDGDEITHPDVFAGNLLEIMKGRPRDGGTAERDGF
jgi:hypothetical protein